MLEIELAGERVVLLGDRALWWPAGRTAIVADIHFGKDDAFRRQGIALPAGAAAVDLARLDRLVQRHSPERLLVLGDFFHAAPHADDDFHAAFAAFRTAHPKLAIEIVAGNHDRHGGVGSLAGAVTWHTDGYAMGPFELRHEAGTVDLPTAPRGSPDRHVLAGHVHPVVALSAGGDRARLPCFWSGRGRTVLPAFGSLTGGHPVVARPGERIYACIAARVVAVPSR